MSQRTSWLLKSAAAVALVLGSSMLGCAAEEPSKGSGSGLNDGAGSSGFGNPDNGGTAGISGSGQTTAATGGNAGAGADQPFMDAVGGDCPAVSQGAKNMLQPADIIIGIDTSGSMGEEIALVQQNMNAFSQQIIASGVDAHVILVATSGSPDPNAMGNCVVFFPGTPCVSIGGGNFSVCIDAPLGSGMCPEDSKAPNYLHVNLEIGSRDILAKFIEAYPMYKSALRPNAQKTFLAITDDDATDPPFNNAAAFISAVNGLEPSDPLMWSNWNYSSIFCETQCPAAAAVGLVHADLVTQTGGVKGDLCLQDFKPVLDKLAETVVATVELACDWEIPASPDGKQFEPGKTNVKVTLDTVEELIGKAASGAACTDKGGWFYDNEAAPTKVVACPATCDRIRAAKEANVNVLFGCDTEPVDLE